MSPRTVRNGREAAYSTAVSLLAKASLIEGLRCPKALWLTANRPDLAAAPTADERDAREQGREVHRLARSRWPGGVTVLASDPERALAETEARLAEGAPVLFEAAFRAGGVCVRTDVLLRSPGPDGDPLAVEIVEVKGTIQPKEEHLLDLAAQRHAVEASGLRVTRASLLLLDPTYERSGALDLARLFLLHDVTGETAPAEHRIGEHAAALGHVFSLPEPPEVEIGPRCRNPRRCAYVAHCWTSVPTWSIYDLWGVPEATLATLRARGILTPDRVPDDVDLPPKARAIVEIAKDGRERVDAPTVRAFLDTIRWPLHVLDFETIGPAIPPLDGTRPFDTIPFQWSLHVQERPGAPAEHVGHLAAGDGDFRREVADRLLAAVRPEGSILCWTPYEGRCLARLAAWSDDATAARLAGVAERLVDLATPFRERWVRLPGARGSYSLKQVLPVLAPDLSWSDLAVRDGLSAARSFLRLLDPATSDAERASLRDDLERYCGRDTEAALRVLEALRARVAPVAPSADASSH